MYSNQSINQSINQSKRILVFQKGRTVINLRIRRTFTLDKHQCHIHSLISCFPCLYGYSFAPCQYPIPLYNNDGYCYNTDECRYPNHQPINKGEYIT